MNTTKLLRDVNAQNCLALLREEGAMSRAEMARKLGTTRTTVGYAVGELARAGLVISTEGTSSAGQMGRPGTAIRLAPEGAFFIGVELAMKQVAVVLVDLRLTVRLRLHLPTDLTDATGEDVIEDVMRAVDGVLAVAKIDTRRIYGVGVSVPSIVSPTGDVMLPPGQQRVSVDVKGMLRSRLPTGWVIRCENNAAAVALSLCETMSAADKADFLFVLLTDGIGSARVRAGRVDRGFRGVAGEIGYLFMGPRLSDNSKRLQDLVGDGRFSPLLAADGEPGGSLEELARSVATSERLPAVLSDWADCLAAGLLNVIFALDPARIILGGPLAILFPHVADQVRTSIAARFLPGLPIPPIDSAKLDPEVVAIGAAASLRQQLFTVEELTHWRSKFAITGAGERDGSEGRLRR